MLGGYVGQVVELVLPMCSEGSSDCSWFNAVSREPVPASQNFALKRAGNR